MYIADRITRVASDFFNVRVIKFWNYLPESVKYAPSVNAFKAGLENLKKSKPDSPYGFWNLSQEIFNRIPDNSAHINYLRNIQKLLCGGIFQFDIFIYLLLLLL